MILFGQKVRKHAGTDTLLVPLVNPVDESRKADLRGPASLVLLARNRERSTGDSIERPVLLHPQGEGVERGHRERGLSLPKSRDN